MSQSSDDDFASLMQALGGIRKLQHKKADLLQQRPRPPAPSRRMKETSFSSPSADTARHVPEHTLESWFHHGLQKKLQRNIRLGKPAPQSVLDLHGYRQREARQQLQVFLRDAVGMSARMLLIIHGKGYNSQSASVLRPLVQHWLSQQAEVLAWCPAQPRDGGHGASYVYLRQSADGLDD